LWVGVLAVKARPAVDRAAAWALTTSTTTFTTIAARKVLAPNANIGKAAPKMAET